MGRTLPTFGYNTGEDIRGAFNGLWIRLKETVVGNAQSCRWCFTSFSISFWGITDMIIWLIIPLPLLLISDIWG